MALFKATAQGTVQMTAEEESEILAERSERETLPNKKARLRLAINDERKIRANSGVVVSGVIYSTDFNSRIELSNAYIYLVRNEGATIDIESKNGEIFTFDINGIGSIYDAVNSHVNAVSAAAKTHFSNVNLLNKNDVDLYDVKSLWP